MNSVGRRNNRRRNGPRRARRAGAVRRMVVVQPNRAGPKRRTRRRTRGGGANLISGPAGRTEVFVFSVNDLKANSSGTIKLVPTFRNAQRFQVEYSSPTTVTRSQTSRLSLSHTRPPPQSAQCLLNSTLRAHNQPWVATLTHSPSQNQQPKTSPPNRLTGRNSGRAR